MDHTLFLSPALEVAPQLLNARFTVDSPDGPVTIRITEVEAYHGVGVPGPYDAGSHSRDRRTERNASMFGPPGHAYVYLSYGIHFAINMVCSPEGVASGVLIRSGEVIDGIELAQRRRAADRHGQPTDRQILPQLLARGPGNLARALGVTRPFHDGLDLNEAPFWLELPVERALQIANGPRVGVSGEAGGLSFPWRFWIPGDATVSTYRPGKNVPGFSA